MFHSCAVIVFLKEEVTQSSGAMTLQQMVSGSNGILICSLLALISLKAPGGECFTSSFRPKRPYWKAPVPLSLTESLVLLNARKRSDSPSPSPSGSWGNGEKDSSSKRPLHQDGSWKLRNDFYTFLNQCSVQSFAFLLKSMRDEQTLLWIENFTDPSVDDSCSNPFIESSGDWDNDVTYPMGDMDQNSLLLRYHGLNAMNMTLFPSWDSYFIKLMENPIETYTVESTLPRVPDYEMEINPPRLCNRLISVREHIAREFANDLVVLSKMGEETLHSYWQSLKKLRQNDVSDSYSDPDEKDGREIKIEPSNLMFLDLSVDSNRAPSPLRKGNFDLLKLLATQEAVHRILNDPKRQKGKDAISNKYLNDFYEARLLSYFDGCQEYGVADLFVKELLKSPPTLRRIGGTRSLVDPTRLAELILEKRKSVALEWKTLAELVPDEHVGIRRLQFEQLMEGMGSGGLSFEQALKEEPPPQDQEKDRDLVPAFVPLSSSNPILDVLEMATCGMNETSVFE